MGNHKRKEPDTKTSDGDVVDETPKNKMQKPKNFFGKVVDKKIAGPIEQDPPKLLVPHSNKSDSPTPPRPYALHSHVSSGKPCLSVGDDTAAPSSSSLNEADLHTPPRSVSQLRTPPSISTTGSKSGVDSVGRSLQMLKAGPGVTVDLDVGDGKYVLKIERSISSSTNEHKPEEIKQLAQSAGLLFLHADILREMGQQLLAQYRASLQYGNLEVCLPELIPLISNFPS